MRIPDWLHDILKRVPALSAAATESMNAFEPWFAKSGMPFFPEFTDHGPEHITHVLTTAVSLISDEAREQFTPEDAAVLVGSTILHDSAMHLTEDGFRALLTDSAYGPPLHFFGERPWR